MSKNRSLADEGAKHPMTRRFIAPAILALWLPPTAAGAVEEVAGGFGFSLGECFDVEGASEGGRSVSGGVFYRVETLAPVEPFDQSGLHVTPKSGRLAVIFGAKTFHTRAACENHRATFRVRFTDRFGPAFRSRRLPNTMTFGAEPRDVTLDCKGVDDPVGFQVSFVDTKPMRLFRSGRDAAREERR